MADDKSGRFRRKKVNFSMVSNSIIRDEKISLKAKGLYTLIQSYITLDNFTVYKSFLQSKCCEGRDAFEGAWKELKKTGYLVQYKMRDEKTKKIYWEYELLDEINPHTENPCMDTKPYTENPYDGSPIVWNSHSMENVGDNNIIYNNLLQNNTNQIISIYQVMDQIGYAAFGNTNQKQVDGIVHLITEILNTSDDKMIWISREDVPAKFVKQRFRLLNKFHIEYVLECLNSNTVQIKNVKSYLITTLYNAPLTIDTYYQNKFMINKGE